MKHGGNEHRTKECSKYKYRKLNVFAVWPKQENFEVTDKKYDK
jgi:hypothetical protein